MYKIRKKMQDYPHGTRIMFNCSDEPDKDYFGILGINRSGQLCIICDDGCYYCPDDNDNVKFIVDYSRLMSL